MKLNPARILPAACLAMTLSACDMGKPATYSDIMEAPLQVASRDEVPLEPIRVANKRPDGVIELEWDDLIPPDWRIDKLIEKYDITNISDDDPRAGKMLEEIQAFWKEAPVVEDHDGKLIKLPGYVVPLDMDANTIREFLLVPYYGACIHTPPPPANQTVYVVGEEKNPYTGQLFDTVWVTGRLKVEKSTSQHGTAGYRIDATLIEPYE